MGANMSGMSEIQEHRRKQYKRKTRSPSYLKLTPVGYSTESSDSSSTKAHEEAKKNKIHALRNPKKSKSKSIRETEQIKKVRGDISKLQDQGFIMPHKKVSFWTCPKKGMTCEKMYPKTSEILSKKFPSKNIENVIKTNIEMIGLESLEVFKSSPHIPVDSHRRETWINSKRAIIDRTLFRHINGLSDTGEKKKNKKKKPKKKHKKKTISR
jgi:hypothetical protein